MMRAVAMVLALGIAGTVCAAERGPGTMRVVSCAPAAPEALRQQLAGLDADVAICAARRGSVIVSRHAILDQREVELAPAANRTDRCIATVARVAQPGVPGGVYAVAARLTASGGSISPADALALAGLVASLPGPVVVAGDLIPTAEKPLSDVLAATPGAGAYRLFTSTDLPAASTSAQGGAAVADLTVHPAIPVLPVRRASL